MPDNLNPMLSISYPHFCAPEALYTFDVVFGKWLGIPYRMSEGAGEYITVQRNGCTLRFPVTFFLSASSNWLELESVPNEVALWVKPSELVGSVAAAHSRLTSRPLPILFSTNRPHPMTIQSRHDVEHTDCPVDIFGTIFFLISRYEEAVSAERDGHDRFPSSASLAARAGFLDRPIVNEYVELLKAYLASIWPEINAKEHQFRILLSHDVDSPYLYRRMPLRSLARLLADPKARRTVLPESSPSAKTWLKVRLGSLHLDPHNTFDFILEQARAHSLSDAFYFLAANSRDPLDCRYRLSDPEIVELAYRLGAEGHEIGFHASYRSSTDARKFASEVGSLRRFLDYIHLPSERLGGRQHFLKWTSSVTPRVWSATGMAYDSTLGYADRPGFRCGTCWEYPLYDLEARCGLDVVERPLVAMDVSVCTARYLGKGWGHEALAVFKDLKDECRLHQGDFTLLWHNSELVSEEQRELYQAVLEC